jgi:hypothetical protein
LREELARLQAELASRDSTVHFAHAGVSTMASFILGGATGKMVLDAGKVWILPGITGAISAGLVVYALVRLLKGRVRHREESARFERMMALRRELELDNPDALLPQR